MPRNITVTFADGTSHVYQNAPDDITPDAVQSRAEKEFVKTVKGIDGGKRAAQAPAPDYSPTQGQPDDASLGMKISQGALNLLAGGVRGAGSIGATLARPFESAEENAARRQGLEENLKGVGADPNSWMYKGGKLGAEIAGTAPIGGVLAKPVGAILGRVAPSIAAPVTAALGSSGMTTGLAPVGLGAKAVDLGLRTGAGAAVGGASAGLVNPEEAGLGALIGGAAPSVLKLAGLAGSKIGNVIKGPAQTPEALAAIQSANALGYVIPPSQAKPTLANRTLEGFAGKLTTAQNASARNAEVTADIVGRDLGLTKGTQITPQILGDIRNTAGQAYEAIGNSGVITPGKSYASALDNIAAPYQKAAQGFPNAKTSPVLDLVESLRSPSFDAGSAVAKIKELRSAADDAFRTGNTDVARASKSAANALENAIEDHLSISGQQGLLKEFRDARQLIAKTYTVEKALNPTTGAIDAKKLGSMLERGKPLTGEMRQAAEFALRFPKAVQTVEKMGSLPQTSPLDWAAGGLGSAATGNPAVMAGVLARPAARSLALSKLVQNKLAQPAGNSRLADLLQNPEVQQLLLRGAPISGAQ